MCLGEVRGTPCLTALGVMQNEILNKHVCCNFCGFCWQVHGARSPSFPVAPYLTFVATIVSLLCVLRKLHQHWIKCSCTVLDKQSLQGFRHKQEKWAAGGFT